MKDSTKSGDESNTTERDMFVRKDCDPSFGKNVQIAPQ